jgi:NADPH:quinone reductase-like Zn-dependent oxidoreductase
VGGIEALHFLRRAGVGRGQAVLINGAGGSIGTLAVQLGKHYGAEVTAVDSADKLAMLLAIGADHVIDYAHEDFTRNSQRYDVIFDVIGKSPFARSMAALAPDGRYLLGNPRWADRVRAARAGRDDGKRVLLATDDRGAPALEQLRELAEAGVLRPVIDRRYPLEETAEAHRYVDSGRKQGCVAIDLGSDAGSLGRLN